LGFYPYVYENGKILEEEFSHNSIKAKILIDKAKAEKIKDFID